LQIARQELGQVTFMLALVAASMMGQGVVYIRDRAEECTTVLTEAYTKAQMVGCMMAQVVVYTLAQVAACTLGLAEVFMMGRVVGSIVGRVVGCMKDQRNTAAIDLRCRYLQKSLNVWDTPKKLR
jgi:hypothetical protein